MPYAYATLSQAIQELANRLYDSTNQFWTVAELSAYIGEALRSWQAHANFWRSEFTFNSRQGIVWYDFTDGTNLPNSLRLFTVTDREIYNLIEYHLLEPQTLSYPLTWTGSSQFSLDDIVNAVQRRRDEILSVTGCTVTRRLVNAAPGRTFLPDTVLDIRRVAWLPVANPSGYKNAILFPDDNFSQESYNPSYTTLDPGTPGVFMQSVQPPLSFDTDIPPAVDGQYECLTVEAGVALSIGAPSTLAVPDDWMWLIKWGALADLLSRESNAKDVLRAKYCELRYRQGLQMLLTAPALLTMRLNNLPFEITAVRDNDYYNPGWQAAAQGTPDIAVQSGLNLIGLSVPPDAGNYGLTASVLQNAPIPAGLGSYIQLGRDDYDVLLDEAQHIASWKMGGQEFAATFPLHERYLKQAAIYNQKLLAFGSFTKQMELISGMEDSENPRLESSKAVS